MVRRGMICAYQFGLFQKYTEAINIVASIEFESERGKLKKLYQDKSDAAKLQRA
jgi:hypothetical protein